VRMRHRSPWFCFCMLMPVALACDPTLAPRSLCQPIPPPPPPPRPPDAAGAAAAVTGLAVAPAEDRLCVATADHQLLLLSLLDQTHPVAAAAAAAGPGLDPPVPPPTPPEDRSRPAFDPERCLRPESATLSPSDSSHTPRFPTQNGGAHRCLPWGLKPADPPRPRAPGEGRGGGGTKHGPGQSPWPRARHRPSRLQEAAASCEPLSCAFPRAGITGLDTALQRPFAVTCGRDHTVPPPPPEGGGIIAPKVKDENRWPRCRRYGQSSPLYLPSPPGQAGPISTPSWVRRDAQSPCFPFFGFPFPLRSPSFSRHPQGLDPRRPIPFLACARCGCGTTQPGPPSSRGRTPPP